MHDKRPKLLAKRGAHQTVKLSFQLGKAVDRAFARHREDEVAALEPRQGFKNCDGGRRQRNCMRAARFLARAWNNKQSRAKVNLAPARRAPLASASAGEREQLQQRAARVWHRAGGGPERGPLAIVEHSVAGTFS